MPQTDSDPNLGGGTANPTSGGQGDKPNSPSTASLETMVSDLTKLVQSQTEQLRALQSQKDRGVQKALNEVSSFREQLSKFRKLEEKLGTEGALALQDELASLRETQQQAPSAGTPGTVGDDDVVKAFSEAGLNLNDDAVKVLRARVYPDQVSLQKAIIAHLNQTSRIPSPTAANSPAPVGTPPPATTPETLQNQFLIDSAKIAANTLIGQDERIRLLSELEVEYRKKGLG